MLKYKIVTIYVHQQTIAKQSKNKYYPKCEMSNLLIGKRDKDDFKKGVKTQELDPWTMPTYGFCIHEPYKSSWFFGVPLDSR